MLPLPNQKRTFPPRFQSSFLGNRVSVAIPSTSHRFRIRFRFGVENQSLSGDSMQHIELIGLDLYCLQLIPDPNESLGVKINPQSEQQHDSGLLYLSDPCSRLCCIALE
ncbi:hypothetical protein DY000_02023008 [Brassica cretica]|uniref:Uncharacterized protein n=1 Tax=Brassica cretica TaxID=69181 RepID=A0ABQ7EIY5_BRACR|nr:hypothetical protein DY000_02023008 [Brassica cretica]